jgi:hypothetical protein
VKCRHEGVVQEDMVRVVDTAHHLAQHPEVCQAIFSSHGQTGRVTAPFRQTMPRAVC